MRFLALAYADAVLIAALRPRKERADWTLWLWLFRDRCEKR